MTGPADPVPMLLTQVISRTRRSAGGAALDAPARLDRYAIRHPLVASVSGQTFAVRDDEAAGAGAAAGAAKLFTSRYTEYVGPGIPTLVALAGTRQPAVGALPRLHAALRMGDNLLLVFDEPAAQPLDQWLMGAAVRAPDVAAAAANEPAPADSATNPPDVAGAAASAPPANVLTMVAALARGIASLHGFGFVHGDLRPSGIFVDPEKGRIALADWGHTIPTHLSLTESGTVTGHAFDGVAYASADVLAGGAPRREDDAYAVACIAYELLAGRHPFDRRSATEVAALGLRPTPIAGISDRCNALLESALAARRIDRTVSLSEMAVAFDAPPTPRRASKGAWGAASAAAGRSASDAMDGGMRFAARHSSRASAAALAWVRRPRAGGSARSNGRERLAWGAVATGALALLLAVAGLDARVDQPMPTQASAVATTPAMSAARPAFVPPTASTPPDAAPAPPDVPSASSSASQLTPRAAQASSADAASEPPVATAPTAFERYVRPMPAPGPVPLAATPVEPSRAASVRSGGTPSSPAHVAANSADASRAKTAPNASRATATTARERVAAARAVEASASARAARRSAFQTTSACPSCDCARLREKRTFTLEPLRVEEQTYLARSCRGG